MNRFLLPIALLLSACSSSPPTLESSSPAAGLPPEIVDGDVRFEALDRLTIEPATMRPVRQDLRVVGRVTLDEDRTARVASFVEGVVESCCKSVGAYVREGEVLAKIHSHMTHEVIAEVTAAQATLQTRIAEREYARQTSERAERLLELKAGAVQAVEQARADLSRAENAVRSAEAGVERAEAHLNFYGLDAERLTDADGHAPHPLIDIKAPAAGVIVSRSVRLGDVVTPSSELYVISDLSRMWVIAQIPEEALSAVEVGMEVSVETRAYPGEPFRGRVTHINTELDAGSMTAQLRCVVPNPQGRLKTGMYADVSLRSTRTGEALLVPEGAVQTVGDETVVFVENRRGEFEARTVRTGRSLENGMELLSGLGAGERIVTGGAFLLKTEIMRDELSVED